MQLEARGIQIVRGDMVVATVGGPNCMLTMQEMKDLAAEIVKRYNAVPPSITIGVHGGCVQWYAPSVPMNVTVLDYDGDRTDSHGIDADGDHFELLQPAAANYATWGHPGGTMFQPDKDMPMSERKHSPAPWDVSRDAVPKGHVQSTIYDAEGYRVATVFRSEENIRLISAAPELLDALTHMIEHYASGVTTWTDLSGNSQTDAILRAASAAIAKATQS